MHVHVRLYVYIYIYIHMLVFIQIQYVFLRYTSANMQIHKYTYSYTYTFTYIYIYIYIYVCSTMYMYTLSIISNNGKISLIDQGHGPLAVAPGFPGTSPREFHLHRRSRVSKLQWRDDVHLPGSWWLTRMGVSTNGGAFLWVSLS